MPIIELDVPGIICSACTVPIENTLKQLEGVTSVNIDVMTKTVTVMTSTENSSANFIEKLKYSLEEVGYNCADAYEKKINVEDNQTLAAEDGPIFFETLEEKIAENVEIIEARPLNRHARKVVRTKKIIRHYWIKGFVGIFLGLVILLLSVYGIVPLMGMFFLAGISSLLTFYIGKETYQHALVQFSKSATLSMESLFTVSTLIVLIVSGLSFFFPILPMMFDAALLILGFKNIGKAIQESANHKFTEKTFLSVVPRVITLEKNLTKALVKNLNPGDVIYVYSNEMVPVNGKCLTPLASVYNKEVTGKTYPQPVELGGLIYAGSIVPGDVKLIKIEVTAREEDSYLAFLDRRLKEAESEKASIETSTKKALQYFVPAVFTVAIISFICVSFLISPLVAIQCAIAVLVSACPCVLGFITPWAVRAGMNKAAKNGVSFKNGKSIEAAAEVDTVVFDLNGTLTEGRPKVIKSTVPNKMLGILCAIEQHSQHPIAKAICENILDQKTFLNLPIPAKINISHHTGMTAEIDTEEYTVGNSEMMKLQQINITKFEKEIKSIDFEHVIFFAKNKKILGYILLEDPLREESLPMINQLKRMGKSIHLCTGADYSTAFKYAKKLNISNKNIRANCIAESDDPAANTKTKYIHEVAGHAVVLLSISPHNKINLVNLKIISQQNNNRPILIKRGEKYSFYGQDRGLCKIVELHHTIKSFGSLLFPAPFQPIVTVNSLPKDIFQDIIKKKAHRFHKVSMIGDDGNDAPAIVASHFGIAVESEASNAITREKAGAIVHQGALWSIINAFTIAEQTVANIKQNLAFSFSYNLITIVAFSGLLVSLGFVLNPALGAALMLFQVAWVLLNVMRLKRQQLPILSRKSPEAENYHNTNSKLKRHFSTPGLKIAPQPSLSFLKDRRSHSYPGPSKQNIFTNRPITENLRAKIINRIRTFSLH